MLCFFSQLGDIEDDKEVYEIDIKISDTLKMGDGMSAYVVYKITSKVRFN